jgi:hypothetical protein
MYSLCWSPKGGSGTTVVAAALAVLRSRHAPTVLLDLAGDAPTALGVAIGPGPGAIDWLSRSGAPPERLWQLATTCADSLDVVPTGADRAPDLTDLAVERLVAALDSGPAHVIVDAGTGAPPALLAQCAVASFMVLRPCFLALRRACGAEPATSVPVLVNEPGRALRRGDVERSLGRAVGAEVPWDPAVARAVDAGLLVARLPGTLSKALAPLVASLQAQAAA